MVTQVGMEALLKPRIDDREANQEVQRIERKVDPMNIEADIDAGGLGDEIDAGGVGAGARAGGGGGGFLSGAVGGRAAGGAGAGLGGLAKGAALPVAISGVVGFGLLKAAEELVAASPHLQKQTSLIQKANENYLRPLGEAFAGVSGGLVEDYYKRSVEFVKAWGNDPLNALKDLFIDAFGVLSPIGLAKTAVDALDRLVRGPQTIEERARALDPRGEGSRAPNFGNLKGLADIARERIDEIIDENIPKINWGEVINPINWGKYIKELVWDDVIGPKIPNIGVPSFPGWGDVFDVDVPEINPPKVDPPELPELPEFPEIDLSGLLPVGTVQAQETGNDDETESIETKPLPKTKDEIKETMKESLTPGHKDVFESSDLLDRETSTNTGDTTNESREAERQTRELERLRQDIQQQTRVVDELGRTIVHAGGGGTATAGRFAGGGDHRTLTEIINESNQTHNHESEVFQ